MQDLVKDQGRIYCVTFNYSDEIRICLISFCGNKPPGSIFENVSSSYRQLNPAS